MTSPRLNLPRIIPWLLLLGLLGMTARPATDPDLWWHLRTGQWIFETGTIPRVDPFSFTRTGQPWVSHEWLSEVVFYAIWRYLGFGGLIVFSAVATTAGFMLLYSRCPGAAHWAAAATVLGAFASAPAWGARPQMFTFALTSLLLRLLERGESRHRILLWIPPLFLLWLNLHAGFALGPVLMLAYAFGLMVEAATGDATWREVHRPVLRILALVLVSLALVPLNPSGTELYTYPLDTLRSASMRSFILEWFSANFHQSRFLPYLAMWLVLLAVLAQTRNRPKARVLVPLVLTAGLSLDAVRHIPIFALLAVPVIASALSELRTSSPVVRPASATVARIRPVFGTVALVLMASLTITRWAVLTRLEGAEEAKQFPKKAVEILRSGDFDLQLFVYYDWGGYAIFKLYPKYQVFVDGRADLYGDDLLHQFQSTVQLRPSWRQVVDSWNLRVVLLPLNSALAQALALEPDWRVAYRDRQAVLMVRAPQSGEKEIRVTKPSPSG